MEFIEHRKISDYHDGDLVIIEDDQGDINIGVMVKNSKGLNTQNLIRFTYAGGHSENTMLALRTLIDAIEKDNERWGEESIKNFT